MPGAIRPNKKAMEIAYKLLKTPKDLRQKNQPNPPERKKREWYVDSSAAQ